MGGEYDGRREVADDIERSFGVNRESGKST